MAKVYTWADISWMNGTQKGFLVEPQRNPFSKVSSTLHWDSSHVSTEEEPWDAVVLAGVWASAQRQWCNASETAAALHAGDHKKEINK